MEDFNEVHVHPINKEKHAMSPDCWCKPTVNYVAKNNVRVFEHYQRKERESHAVD